MLTIWANLGERFTQMTCCFCCFVTAKRYIILSVEKSLYSETSKRHKATLAYAINKDGRYANMNHLNDFRPERDKNE